MMKPSGVLNFENVPQDAGDPDVKVYVNGEEVSTGGGGDSDFTTTTITVVNNKASDIYARFACLQEDAINEMTSPFIEASSTEDVTIIMYKGSAVGYLYDNDGMIDTGVSITGDGVHDDGEITVTGECEITVS